MSPSSRPLGRRTNPALVVGSAGFFSSILAATFLDASLPTWIAGYLALWILTGSVMTALWPAPVPTRAQVAAMRGEERVAWPAVRARLIPVFSPWIFGIGPFVGMAAADRGWGDGNLRFADRQDGTSIGLDLAMSALLAPLGVLLLTNITFPALYAVHHHGSERLWGLARTSGFSGMFGLMTCAIFTPESSRQLEGGHVNPVDGARFVGRLFLGDSADAPGGLVPLAWSSVALIALGVWFLVRSGRPERGEAPPDEDSEGSPPERH